MFFDALYESLRNGGWVLWPIFGVGAVAIYLMLNSLSLMKWDFYRKNFDELESLFVRRLQDPQSVLPQRSGGIVRDVLKKILDLKDLNSAERIHNVQRLLKKAERELDSGLYLVSVFAAAAPLLGLLGTVQGMVMTFETITLYGNSNPVLLADGISEALITTQSGLVIAFPVLLFKHRIEDRIFYVKHQLKRLCLFALEEMKKR